MIERHACGRRRDGEPAVSKANRTMNDARTPLAAFFSILLDTSAEVFSLQAPHHPRIVVRHFAQRIHEMETFALD